MILLIAWMVILGIATVGTSFSIKARNKNLNTMNNKQIRAGIIGSGISISGTLLCLFAQDIAWPSEYGYSGSRGDTTWAIRERAYQDIGLAFLIFGLAVLLVTIINWLWSSSPNRKD